MKFIKKEEMLHQIDEYFNEEFQKDLQGGLDCFLNFEDELKAVELVKNFLNIYENDDIVNFHCITKHDYMSIIYLIKGRKYRIVFYPEYIFIFDAKLKSLKHDEKLKLIPELVYFIDEI